MKKRNLISLSLSMLLTTGLFTNIINKQEEKEVNAMSRSTMDEFTIAGFVNYYDFDIKSLEEQTADLARSGMNWIDTPLWYVKSEANSQLGRNNNVILDDNYGWKGFNDLCKELNIYFSIQEKDAQTPSESSAEDLVAAARNLDRCIGYYVKDEPSAASLESIASIYNKIMNLDPTRFPYVNLFPNYAGASNLGGSYEDYVNNWISKVGKDNLEYLYFDHYPFTGFEDVRASYFSDVETIRKAAFENGRIKTGGYTQMGYWNGMREPTVAEARWSMNSLLTYGMKSISHFTWVSTAYVEPPAGEGMRDFVLKSDGTPTERYVPMQKLNWQTRQLGPILMNIDVAHAYHTGDIPTGTESLPKNFLIQPTSTNDNLIMSICYSKDDSEKYLMLFNKELEGKQKYTFKVDNTSGLESLTWYQPDSFDTLPDPTKELNPATEVEINFADNQFSVELDAGEMRLYKLNGDVAIKEPLSTPKLSVKSGTQLGEQYVTISSADEDAEIYYTTDGTYPTYASTRYTGPIKVGEGKNFGLYSIKAIAIRGEEISDVVTGEYIITDGATNVCLNKTVKFTGDTEIWQGTSKASSVVDGGFDPFNCYGSTQGNPCFAIVDFGEIVDIDKVVVKAWHDWEFVDVIIQTALDENFTQGVYTVYNNDNDNSMGCGIGSDGAYTENPNGGHTFKFNKVSARYIRFTNTSARNEIRKSMFEEIQAYSYYDAGTNLLTNSSDWRVTGGGTWTNNSGVVSQSDAYDHSNWDRSYTYTKKKYKNFILEGKFTMNINDTGAWGYAGFGLYKPTINSVQSDVDQGYYVAIEPRGRALLWNGKKPELGPDDANISGFALGNEFTLKIISIDDTISVSVNGKPVMYVRDSRLNREAGYISIHGGLVPIDVSHVSITELSSDIKPLTSIECLKTGGETKVAVERFTDKVEVNNVLPSTLPATDTSGNTYELDVKWNLDDYNASKTGFVTITGNYVNLPSNLVNLYNVKASANVFVRAMLDTSDLEELVRIAKSLDPNNFTEESFEGVTIKLEAAEALLADKYLVQSDIGVGNFQLYDAIYKYLVSTVDRSTLKTSIDNANVFKVDSNISESGKKAIELAIAEANEVYNNVLSTSEDISEAANNLRLVVEGIETLENVKEPFDKPDIDTLIEATKVSTTTKGCKGSVSSIVGFMASLLVLLELKRKK